MRHIAAVVVRYFQNPYLIIGGAADTNHDEADWDNANQTQQVPGEHFM